MIGVSVFYFKCEEGLVFGWLFTCLVELCVFLGWSGFILESDRDGMQSHFI